jgi:hypothetical protein
MRKDSRSRAPTTRYLDFRPSCLKCSRWSSRPSATNPIDNDDPLIGAFLDDLKHQRKNGAGTRKTWVAAIRSPFRYAALRHPDHSAMQGVEIVEYLARGTPERTWVLPQGEEARARIA